MVSSVNGALEDGKAVEAFVWEHVCGTVDTLFEALLLSHMSRTSPYFIL